MCVSIQDMIHCTRITKTYVFCSDESMNLLYADGKGKVFQGMVSWLTSTDDDLQLTGVLAMGNFARTGNMNS